MTIVVLESCPPALRGDMTKWLLEINTGVYVGKINARVREQLWERITANIRQGRATMVWSSRGEQGMSFKVHNTAWQPIDFDGITLMMRPLPGSAAASAASPLRDGFSKAARARVIQRSEAKRIAAARARSSGYVVIDVETTGLNVAKDSIVEIAALKVRDGSPTEEFSSLVKCEAAIPDEVVELTGITSDLLASDGRDIEQVLRELVDFIADDQVVCHNAQFDIGFLQAAAKKIGTAFMRGKKCEDTLALARRNLRGITSFKLTSIAKQLELDTTGAHRALKDCYLTHLIYEKLKQS